MLPAQDSGLGQNRFAVFDADPVAGVVIHADNALLAVEQVSDLVTGRNLFAVVDGLAALLHGGFHVAFLHSLLDFAARVAAGNRACCGRELLSTAIADLVAQDAADDGADRRAGNALFILY